MIKVIGETGSSEALDWLITTMDDRRNVRVHQFALEALGKIGDSQAVNPLITILEDKNTCGRDLAAKALGRSGDLRAVDPLIAILRDKDEDVPVAHAARLTLKELGWKPD